MVAEGSTVERPNGLRQPRAGGLARRIPSWKAVYRISTRKIAHVPASRLHAVLGSEAVIPATAFQDRPVVRPGVR
jgi:hypothetical protein